MSNEDIKVGTDGGVDFDFGFDNFRPMGFTFEGVVVKASIEKPAKEKYSFTDKRTGKLIEKDAKPQLVLLVNPIDHSTKSGNPYPEYFPLTHNSRSKLGIFIEHLKKLGISLGNDPSKIEGLEFQWEIKEVSFGGVEPTRVMVPISQADALSGGAGAGTAGRATTGSPFDSLDAETVEAVLESLQGVSTGDAVMAVSRNVRNANVLAGIANGSLIDYLTEKGRLTTQGDTYVTGVAGS